MPAVNIVQPVLSQTKRKRDLLEDRIKSEDTVIQDSDSDSDTELPSTKQTRVNRSFQETVVANPSPSEDSITGRRVEAAGYSKACDYCTSQNLPCKGKPRYACEECARRHKSCSQARTGRALARKGRRKSQASATINSRKCPDESRSESSDDDSDYEPMEGRNTALKDASPRKNHRTREQEHTAHANKFDAFGGHISYVSIGPLRTVR